MSSLLMFAAFFVVFYLLMRMMPKPKNEAETFQATVSEQGAIIPVVHGSAWVGANVVWYGNAGSEPIRKKQMMQTVTTGHKYYADIHVVLSLGSCDLVRKIMVDTKKTVYDGFLPSGTASIDKKNLFGETEGGVSGNITLGNGGFSVRLSAQGEFATKYKGVTSLVFHSGSFNQWATTFEKGDYRGFYFGNSPYLKQMTYLVQCVDSVFCPPALVPYRSIAVGGVDSDETIYKRISVVVDDTFLLDSAARDAIRSDLHNMASWYRQQVNMKAVFRFAIVATTPTGVDIITASNYYTAAPSELDIDNFCNLIRGDTFNIPANILRSSPALFFNSAQNAFFSYVSSGFNPPVNKEVNELYIYSKGAYGLTQERFDSSNAKNLARAAMNTAKICMCYIDYLSTGFGNDAYYRLLFNDQILPIDSSTEEQYVVLTKMRASGDFAVFALNPAVIIYDCLTNTEWGLGIWDDEIDLPSFQKAAAQLYSEGFGLCFTWGKEGRILDYVDEVRAHIGAVLYEDSTTGKWVLRLNREDYNVDELPILNKSNISSIDSLERSAFSDRTSQIVLRYTNVKINKTASITISNSALISANNSSVNSKTVDYKGIVDSALATRVAMRDLRQASSSLATMQIKVPKNVARGFNLGDCFILDYQKYSKNQLVMRITEIDLGNILTPTATLNCIQDVFDLPNFSVITEEISFDTEKAGRKDISAFKASELSYYQAAKLQVNPEKIVGSMVGRADGAPTINAAIYSTSGGSSSNFDSIGVADYTPYFTLEAPLNKVQSSISTTKFKDFGVDSLKDSLPFIVSINNENVRVNSFSLAGGVLTLSVSRGADDTTPRAHAVGSFGIVIDGFVFSDLSPKNIGDELYFRATSLSSDSESLLATAPESRVVVGRRFEAPLPPINMTINGLLFPNDALGDISVNYVIQGEKSATRALAWGDSAPTPADGVTISARALNGSTVLKQYTGVTGDSIIFSENDLIEGNVTVELWSVKAGVESWQRISHTFAYSKVNMRIDIQIYSPLMLKGITNELAAVSVIIDENLSANYMAESSGSNGIKGKAEPFAEITIEIEEESF